MTYTYRPWVWPLLAIFYLLLSILLSQAQWNTNNGTNLFSGGSPFITNAPGTNATGNYGFKTNTFGTNATGSYAFRTNTFGTNVTSSYAFLTNRPGTNATGAYSFLTNTFGTNVSGSYGFKTNTFGTNTGGGYAYTTNSPGSAQFYSVLVTNQVVIISTNNFTNVIYVAGTSSISGVFSNASTTVWSDSAMSYTSIGTNWVAGPGNIVIGPLINWAGPTTNWSIFQRTGTLTKYITVFSSVPTNTPFVPTNGWSAYGGFTPAPVAYPTNVLLVLSVTNPVVSTNIVQRF